MDSANKQTAVIAEATQGTTPSSPAFKILRDIRVAGSASRSATRSPERRSDRTAASFFKNLATFNRSIEIPWVRDEGSDILLNSLLSGSFGTGTILRNGSTKSFFTLEEKFEGGATDPYRRTAGCVVDSLAISLRNGEPGSMSFALQALSESVGTAALGTSTYAAPTPGYAPVTPADIAVGTLFGFASPKVTALNLNIGQNLRPQHSWGSVDPFGIGLGLLQIEGSVSCYFAAAADYSAFATPTGGLKLDLTIGGEANYKDRIILPNCVVHNPDLDDPGPTGDHMVTLNFFAMYDATGTCAIEWYRNVA